MVVIKLKNMQDEKSELIKRLAEANRKIKEYEEKAEKAEKASKMKSLFLANMSHEIRTPLNAIEGFSRIITETDSADERIKYLGIIESNSNRLTVLINEILDLSKVEQGDISINKENINLTTMCNEIINVFKLRTTEDVKIVVEKTGADLFMETDKNRLMQVFSNLIGNALKHTKYGSITIGYRLIKNNSKIKFFVQDTGEGIKLEDQKRIFELYESNDSGYTGEKKGFGLGLPLSKMIVEKMGGEMSLESNIGEGATFSFSFPYRLSEDRTDSSLRTTTKTIRVDAVAESQKKLILVAEDSDNNYELVRIVLEKLYKLVRAKDGIEAVTINEELRPDIILMDMKMPNMDGLDATRIIKEVYPDIPIIALSAFAFSTDIQKAKEAGCIDFLAKPFRIESLRAMIDKYIIKNN
jgi:CheY-like chemotaxis protein/nitrogen-specific signal transduction histidine kinase